MKKVLVVISSILCITTTLSSEVNYTKAIVGKWIVVGRSCNKEFSCVCDEQMSHELIVFEKNGRGYLCNKGHSKFSYSINGPVINVHFDQSAKGFETVVYVIVRMTEDTVFLFDKRDQVLSKLIKIPCP